MPGINDLISQSSQLSVQSNNMNAQAGVANFFVVSHMARAGLYLMPWWSIGRDRELRTFWKGSDHLSGTLYTMESRMTAIPFRIIPRGPVDRDVMREATAATDLLYSSPDFGDGWITSYGKWVEDLLSQDNGAFFEVIGAGPKDGAIIGQALSIAHLDSGRCTRTGNAQFPVIYEDLDGKRYKLHYTRVISVSQMTSPIAEMFGVGFCACSRAINIAQTLVDILVYKQEKLGSRPHRQIIITQGGLDPGDLQTAFELADQSQDQIGLSRYSKVVVGGSSSLPQAGLQIVELSSMPDGFNEETSVTLGMATLALAFGVDARELFPALTSGATRADAILQHLKQRGKGPGQILQQTEQQFNFKFLPSYLRLTFDFQDDAEDRQRAEINQVRANSRVQNMSTGVVTSRTMREKMLEEGEITQDEFDQMEIEDGRLEGGDDILVLFYSKDPAYAKILDMGVEDPLNVQANDQASMLSKIYDQRKMAMETIANAKSEAIHWSAVKAGQALNYLESLYLGGNIPSKTTPSPNYVDPRLRTENPGRPTQSDANPESADSASQNEPPQNQPL